MLEKILEEIERRVSYYRDNATVEYYVDICSGLREAQDIIHKHMNAGWIPVEERLPEEGITCLVTVEYSGFMGMYGTWIKTVHIEKNSGEWWEDCAGGKVIAWQPLPEPYIPRKGEEE